MTRPQQEEPQGCLIGLFRALITGVLQLFGLGGRAIRNTLEPIDTKYREYVDTWVSERLAGWLHETRPDIDTQIATKVLLGGADQYAETARIIRETLVDAKVTFSQRDEKQYLEIEAYMAPRQLNGRLPQVLRWRAEREITWQEIPNDVRERLIRARQPVTLAYAIPQGQ
ncbi:MAG: hypothetical protein U0528_04755 [Anaerolineae bacterium]|nr:hypothetical protein [Anaerolineae bacterium]